MTCTMPWSRSPIRCSRMPNSTQLPRSVSTCSRDTSSAMGSSTAPSGRCGPPRRWSTPGGAPAARPAVARRRPAGWSPRGPGAGRRRAGRARRPTGAPGAATARPVTLADLVAGTAFPRATAHRIAVALELRGLLRRDDEGRWLPGPALVGLAGSDRLLALAPSVLSTERCPAARALGPRPRRRPANRPPGGTAARSPRSARTASIGVAGGSGVPDGAVFSPSVLRQVRRRGWAASSGQREPGVGGLGVRTGVRRPHRRRRGLGLRADRAVGAVRVAAVAPGRAAGSGRSAAGATGLRRPGRAGTVSATAGPARVRT